ncbi:MAG TPA: cytochrome c oxidase subunit 3 [Pyrinomonadaceae bacterium]|jgi:cytochrome c oxidase subunit 3
MVTTATTTTETRDRVAVKERGRGYGGGGPRPGGNGARRGPGGRDGGDEHARGEGLPQQYRIGMWMALAAIAMMFTALTSAYVIRAANRDWRPVELPHLLWLSTALIVASSVAFEVARRSLRRAAEGTYRRWLAVSLLLGFGFLVSQLLAWRQLVAQGVYLASNPYSSFFYLLTGLHGLHLLGGILGLLYLLARTLGRAGAEPLTKRRAVADAVGIYWHFMDGLWVCLFALLFLWR